MIILVSGDAGAGKDTVADMFVSRFGFKNVKFAAEIKRLGCELADMTPDDFEDRAVKEMKRPCTLYGLDLSLSPRDVAIIIGQSARIGNKHHWSDTVKTLIDENELVVISDWRFPKELTRIAHNHPGRTIIPISIERRLKEEEIVTNSCEGQLKDCPMSYVIENNGTFKDLEAEVDHVFEMAKNWDIAKSKGGK